MRRKAGAGRPPPEIGRLTAAKAVRGAVAQAAEDVAGLAAVAGTVEEARTTLAGFVDTVPDPALLGLIEGPGGRFGLMVLDAQVVAALIEVQTTGRVVPRPADSRAPTRTDAIMCADFIDRVLDLVDERVSEAELDVAPSLAGFRYAIALSETRAITMTLDDVPYRRFQCTVDLGRGAKSGALQVLLPFDPPGHSPRGGEEAAAFAEALRAQVLEVEAQLSATLARRRMSLAEVSALTVGSLIAVPRAALGQVSVEALDGTVVARGRLGQMNGKRAVRLTSAVSQDIGAGFGSGGGTPDLATRALANASGVPGDGFGGLGDAGGLAAPATDPGLADLGALGDAGGLGDLGAIGADDLAGLGALVGSDTD